MKIRVVLTVLVLHFVGVALPGTVAAQAGRSKVEEGNRLYAEGRFEEAHQKYLEALAENPSSPLIRFNAGNALYQSQDFQRALEAYREAVESGDESLASAAWYNLGNTLFRGQQLEPSLEAYKQALRMNPGDADAKHNLERVLERMQQQEQQDQDQQSQDQQDQGQQNPDQGGQGQQEPQEGENPEQEPPEGEGSQDRDPQEDPSSEDQSPQGEQPAEGRMTPEQARRLLEAIDENPEDVNRKPASARGRRPRKIW